MNAYVVANGIAVLRTDDSSDWSAEGTMDNAGTVRFALQDLPERAFNGSELKLALTISGTRVPLALPDGGSQRLLDALISDPASRVARARVAAAKAACDNAVAAAREAQRRDLQIKPDDVIQQWNGVKIACADNWNEERERELGQAKQNRAGWGS